MFYINLFFKIFKQHWLAALHFVVFTVLLSMSLIYKDNISKYIEDNFTTIVARPYFHVVYNQDVVQTQKIAGQINNLPGVMQIKMIPTEQIQAEVNKIMSGVGIELDKTTYQLNHAGIKIILADNIPLKSQNLIRDYVLKLIGEENAMVSEIKKNELETSGKNYFLEFLSLWGLEIFYSILVVVWTASLFFLNRGISRECYFVEKFQRRTNVGLKVYLLGCTSIFAIITLSIVFITEAFSFLILGMLFILFMVSFYQKRKIQWH